MKKLTCFILSLILMLSVCVPVYAASESNGIEISLDSKNISDQAPTQFGVNLNRIQSSNLVNNGSFEESDKGWNSNSSEFVCATGDSIHKNNPTFNVVTVDKNYLLENDCYGGAKFIKNESYDFSMFVKNIDFEGTISVWLNGDLNKNEITRLSTAGISKNSWTQSSATLTAVATETGSLSIKFEGTGSIEIDYISLVAQSSYGHNNEKWKGFGITQNAYTALFNLKPSFINFSLNENSWKDGIGAEYERQNSEIGLHEYLQLCSDLGIIAIPTLNANKFKAGTNKFKNYKQDILDLIEYANSSWETSYYASLRYANGAPEPFNLKYIQILGSGERFKQIKKAIEKKYDYITVLGKDDIAVIQSEDNTIKSTISATKNTLKNCGFVMFDNFFDDVLKLTANETSYSTNYYSQMLISNNQGTNILDVDMSAENVEFVSEATIDKSQNFISISFANSGSNKNATIDIEKLDSVTSASIQYISDGYLSSYNDIGKQYVAPEEKELKIDNESIEFKVPENSVSVVRITYNNANSEALFSLPETIDLKAKNYVPPVIIAVIIALAVAIPIGTIFGFIIYKKVISKNKKEDKDE